LSNTSDDLKYNISLRDAIGIWLNTANSTNPVRFREACYVSHCNKLCPEEIRIEQDDSFLWKEQAEILVYCFVVMLTLICFIIKGIFSYWHYILLHRQSHFLQRAKDIETRNAIYQVRVKNIYFTRCVNSYTTLIIANVNFPFPTWM